MSKDTTTTTTTLEDLQDKFPKAQRKRITQTTVDIINKIESTGDFDAGEFSDLIVNYNSILSSGRFKVEDYIKAVLFVSHYSSNGNNQVEAYIKTFPERVARRRSEGKSDYASGGPPSYFQNELVQAVLNQAVVPTRLFHASKEHDAIERLYSLMLNKSGMTTERIQMESANSLLQHLKMPDTVKMELDIGVSTDVDMIGELRKATQDLAAEQLKAITSGKASAKDVAHSNIINVTDAEVI